MAAPPSTEVEVPPGLSQGLESNSSPRSVATPHWIISTEDIIQVDEEPLPGNVRRTGNVSKAYWNNSLVAIKLLSSEASVEALLDRVSTWQSLRHPRVCQVFGVSSLDADPLFIIVQYYPHGNVNDYLSENPDADRAEIVFGCALGMRYLHGRGIVHGSLKPNNLMIAENGQVCIADYGMVEIRSGGGASPHRYYSPEAWKGTISRASDVFAFAMTGYEIFSGAPPWGVLSEDDMFQLVVRKGERPDRPDAETEQKVGLTDGIWDLIEAAWRKDARLRPTFAQIVHLWQEQAGVSGNSRPGSSSDIVGEASSQMQANSSLSQWRLDNLQAWSANEDPDSFSPPAYRDPSIRRMPASRSFSARSSIRTVAAPPPIRSATEDFSRSDHERRSPPPSFLMTTGSESTASTPSTSAFGPLSPARPNTASSMSSTFGSISTFPPSQMPMPSISEVPLVSRSATTRSYDVYPTQERQDRHVMRSISERGVSERGRMRGWDSPRMVQRSNHTSMNGSDNHSSRSGSPPRSPSSTGRPNAVLLVGALQTEVKEGRKAELIDDYLLKAQIMCHRSSKEVQKLVTAGIVPLVIILLKARAVSTMGLESVLMTLGLLACDTITANTIYRTNTTVTLIEIIKTSLSDNCVALAIWCINRICRSQELAIALVKQDIAPILLQKCTRGERLASRHAAWCLGSLIHTNDLADSLSGQGAITISTDYLKKCTEYPDMDSEDVCAALYFIARIARTIPLSKSLAKTGCLRWVMRHLSSSENAQVLDWSARVIGCMMRPNSSDMAKVLLDAGSAQALARLPSVLQEDEIEPLASFAFAIQRFSCAEWGGGTRKALVDAGVVDSLLSALRTAADVPCAEVHIELALAVSFLGDIGGKAIRKEIIRAGGIEILQRVAAEGAPEVAKACNIAATSITGNLWTRNAASAKTALAHNWNGGCPEYQPSCPLPVAGI